MTKILATNPKDNSLTLHDELSKKSSEELLRQTQASLNAIIENSTATVFSLDRKLRYTNFNSLLKESLYEAYGVNIKIGDVVFEFLYKDDPKQAEEWRSVYMRALEGESMQFIKEFVIAPQHRFVRFYINPIKEDEVVIGLSCLAIDITRERNGELAIARSEAKFRALIENNQEAIMVRDKDRNLIYASSSMARMLGLPANDIPSFSRPEMLVHEEDISKLRRLYENAARFPGVPFPTTLRIRHSAGHYIWIEGVMTNMLDVPQVNGYVCNFRDVTERMEMDIHNEKISKELVKRNENLEQYAYIVSHNLRSPVANLLGLANLLELPSLDQEDRDQSLRLLISSAKRLDEVIKDLSSILQLNEGLNQHKETVRFQELVDNIRQSIQPIISEDDVRIESDFAQCPAMITIKSYMFSIFYNLISNSIKYRKPDSCALIRIKSETINGRTMLVFEDNGLGIDLSIHGDKVFGLYRRFHPCQAEGKGMGLFMVRTQVQNLGGHITLRSTVGKGTVFTIDI